MLKTTILSFMLMPATILAFAIEVPVAPTVLRAGQRGQRDQKGGRQWSEQERQEKLEGLAKTLAERLEIPNPAPENSFLHARAAEILERTKQSQENNFQFDRLVRATDALLRASERIFTARNFEQPEAETKREAALFLQRCYFRAHQAEYFAGLSGEKEAKQYVKYIRSLYQQARSAYDARQFERARMLGDASSLMVMALENIAHASLKVPDPPVIK